MIRTTARLPAALCTSHHPRLVGDVLNGAGVLAPGKVTWWHWPGIADAPRALKISAEPDALWLELDGAEPQRIACRRAFVFERVSFLCPLCSRGGYHLYERDGRFMCGSCRGLGYLSRASDLRDDAAAQLAGIKRKLAANRVEHDRLMRDRIEAEAVIVRQIARRTARLRREIEHAEAGADRAGPRGHLDA